MIHLSTLVLLITASAASDYLPHLVPRQTGITAQGASACASFYSLETSCAAKTSGFTDLVFEDQASCLCYQGTSYAPTVFDGYISACLGYFATANSSYYSSIGGSSIPRNPCAAATPTDTMTDSSSASATSDGGQTATAASGQSASSSQGSATASQRGAANRHFSVSWIELLGGLLAPVLVLTL